MDVVAILDKLNSLGYIRTNRVINKYYSIYCPFHNNGNERKASFGVLITEERRNGQTYPIGWCHCFTCGYVSTLPDMISEILKSRSISQSGMDWLIENIPGFEASYDIDLLIPQDVMDQLSNKFAVNYIAAKELHQSIASYVTEDELARYRYTVPYMYERKLTDDIIAKFDIGVDMNWIPPGRKKPIPCITFPVRDREGRTLFLCRRSIQGKLYNYPEDVTKPLYGIDMIPFGCKSVIICESCINALTCWTWGYPAVALLGTGNAYQISQLKSLGVNEFVICTDGDEAGRRSAAKLKRALRSNAIIWTIRMLDGKDVNDLDKETFDRLYSEKE